MNTKTDEILDRALLTTTQAKILDVIHSYTLEHGCQPSLRELMRIFEYTSPNGVYCHLRALALKGWIALGNGGYRARAIRFLAQPDGRPFHGFTFKETADG